MVCLSSATLEDVSFGGKGCGQVYYDAGEQCNTACSRQDILPCALSHPWSPTSPKSGVPWFEEVPQVYFSFASFGLTSGGLDSDLLFFKWFWIWTPVRAAITLNQVPHRTLISGKQNCDHPNFHRCPFLGYDWHRDHDAQHHRAMCPSCLVPSFPKLKIHSLFILKVSRQCHYWQ